MIVSGDQVIMITLDDAQKILDALVRDRTLADYEKLSRLGILHIVEELRGVLREDDDEL